MRKKGILSRVFAGAMAVVLAVTSTEISAPMRVKAADSYVYTKQDVKQIVNDFGIIAFSEMHSNAHTNTNFITTDFYGDKNCGTNIDENGKRPASTQESTYIKNLKEFGTFNERPMVGLADHLYLGKDYELACGQNDNKDNDTWSETYITTTGGVDDNGRVKEGYAYRKISAPTKSNIVIDTDTKEFANIGGMKQSFIDYNERLIGYAKASSNVTKDFNQQRDIICPAGVSYLNLTYGDMNPASDIVFRFHELSTNTSDLCVINIDCAGQPEVKMSSSYKVGDSQKVNGVYPAAISNNESNFSSSYNKIVFNFYDSSNAAGQYQYNGKITSDRESFGTVIAPSATVVLNQNWDGVVVADKVYVEAEYHRIGRALLPDEPANNQEPEKYSGVLSLMKTFEDRSTSDIVNMSDNERNAFLSSCSFKLYFEEDGVLKPVEEKNIRWNHVDAIFNVLNGEKTIVKPAEDQILVEFFVKDLQIPRGETYTYYIIEEKTPEGYVLPTNYLERDRFKITIKNETPDGAVVPKYTVTYFDENSNPINKIATCTNKKTEVPKAQPIKISKNGLKTDNTSVENLSGATLKLYKGTTLIDTWNSGSEHEVQVEFDTTYTLEESKVPGGYNKANNIVFKIKSDGEIEFTTVDDKSQAASKLEERKIVMVDVEKAEVPKTFSKVDADGQGELPGATIRIIALTSGVTFANVQNRSETGGPTFTTGTTDDGKAYIEWKSTTKPMILTKLFAGDYKMVEVGAPNGYAYATEKSFSIDVSGNIVNNAENKITMSDEVINATFSKKDTGNAELAGAKLWLIYESGEGDLGDVTTVDSSRAEELIPGTTADDKKYISWTSTTTSMELTKLPVGSYTLKEDTAPAGYFKADEIKFVIKKDGKIYYKESDTVPVTGNTLTMVDESVQATFSKKAAGAESELPGAKLELSCGAVDLEDSMKVSGPAITVSTDKHTISWESTDEELVLQNLPAGTYTMKETGAPKGYKYADQITFTMGADGIISGYKNNKVTMTDDAIGATFSKTSVNSTSEVAGAELKITCIKNAEDTDVASGYLADVKIKGANNTLVNPTFVDNNKNAIKWTSTDKAFELTLLPIGTYTMEETVAPAGYKASTTVITFKVNTDGSISTVTNNDTDHWVIGTNKVTVKDEPIKKSFNKVNAASKEEVPGATIWVIAQDGQNLANVTTTTSGVKLGHGTKNNKSYVSWKSLSTGPVELSQLPVGKYVMHEEGAPTGYKYATDITFVINENYELCDASGQKYSTDENDANNVNKLTMEDEAVADGTFDISKRAINGTDELPGATLEIWNGNTQVLTWVSIDSAKTIAVKESVTAGDTFTIAYDTVYTLKETSAPEGYTVVTEEIKFKVVKENNTPKVVLVTEGIEDVASVENDTTLVMRDTTTRAKFSKVISGAGNEIPGASIAIVYLDETADSTVFANVKPYATVKTAKFTYKNKEYPYIGFVSKDKPTEITGLPAGKYAMVETNAPKGYSYAESIEFEIAADGTLKKGDAAQDGNHLKMEDKVIEAKFSKKTAAFSPELPGATIQIIDNNTTAEEFKTVTARLADSNTEVILKKGINSDGKNYIQWTSGNEEVVLSMLPVGKYIMRETGAPKGYKYTTDMQFEIRKDGKLYSNGVAKAGNELIMLDEAFGDIVISKKDILKDQQGITEELPDAHFVLYEKEKNGTVVKEWTSKASGPETIKRTELKADTQYVLVETQAPSEYTAITDIVFKLDRNGDVQFVSADANAYKYDGTKRKMTLLNTPYISGTFSKVAVVKNGDEVPGATLQLFFDGNSADLVKVTRVSGPDNVTKPTVDGQTCIQWTSTDEPLKLTQLPVGNYRMVETNAPDGYTMYKSEITFQVRNDGKFYATANDQTPINANNKIEMVDEVIKNIQISKKEIVGDKPGSTELPGAKLSLHEGTATGKNVVEPWVGGTTPKVIDGKLLKVDTTYVIVEEAAPNGYAITSTVSFKIDEDGNVTNVDTKAYDLAKREVTLFDAPIEAVFSKQDTDEKNVEIPGATIQLIADNKDADLTKVTGKLEKSGTAVTLTTGTNAAGKKFIQWTSGKEAVKLTKLPAGKYTMSETGAPNGYAYADDITFTITAEGKVTGFENNKIVMNDDAIAPLKISKVEIMGSNNKGAQELPGAKMTLYKGNGTKGEKIDEWISSDKPYEVPAEKFEEGQTYTIHEVAAPKGFRVASDITFTYGKNGTILNATNAYKVDQDQRLIAMLDDSELGGTYSFSKVTLGGKEIYGAKMQVVPLEGQDLSKVEKLNGSGGKDVVITKDSITWVTTAKTLGLVAVPDGKYKLVEVEAPDGYIVADPIEFIAQDGILTDGTSKVELKDLYDPNTTTVSVYSRYYNVETFDPNHEDIIQTNTPTANSTEFELRDENGDKVKIVNKIVTRREIADGVDVTVVTFVIDTTQWEPSPVPRTYTITESKKPTAKEDGGYTADDGEMVTTYTITKDYVTVDGKKVVNYDRVWSNKYQTNVAYDETNPDKIPLYSHTKTLSGNATEEPQEEKVSFNATVPPEAQQVFPEVKSPKTGEESFPVGLFGGLVSAMICLGAYTVLSYKKKKEN